MRLAPHITHPFLVEPATSVEFPEFDLQVNVAPEEFVFGAHAYCSSLQHSQTLLQTQSNTCFKHNKMLF